MDNINLDIMDNINLDIMYEALVELNLYSKFKIVKADVNKLQVHSGETMPDLTIIQNKYDEKKSTIYTTYAFKYLRTQRDLLLDNTDKYSAIDYPHATEEIKQSWLDYRQTLRNLPSNSSPQLDENGELNNVTWPTPPS